MTEGSSSADASSQQAASPRAMGVAAAAAAYGVWGFFPAFFKLLEDANAIDVTFHRILWSVPAAGLLAAFAYRARGNAGLGAVFANPRALATLALTAALIGGNWWVFVWAVSAERVMEASLGYYIAPLATVGFGLVFLRERLSVLQTGAVGLAAMGVAILTISTGVAPWVSLALAGSFALYGLLRKTVTADARTGLFVETALLSPIALVGVLWLHSQGDGAFGREWGLSLGLMAAGPVTVAPLVLFALAARRIRLATLGLLQFIAPTLHFGMAVSFGEPFSLWHAVTFAFIWAGIVLFCWDAWKAERRTPASAGV